MDYDDDGSLDLCLIPRHELLHTGGNGTFPDASSLLPPRDASHAWSDAVWFDFDQD